MISDVHIVSSVDLTLPFIHCKIPSCRSCQRLSVVPQPSFPTIQLVCICCSILPASLHASPSKLVLLIFNTSWWSWSLSAIKSRSIWSFGSNQSWCFLLCLPSDALACLKLVQQGVLLSSHDWARALSISCTRLSAWLVFLSLLVLGLTDFIAPFWLCFFPLYWRLPSISTTGGQSHRLLHGLFVCYKCPSYPGIWWWWCPFLLQSLLQPPSSHRLACHSNIRYTPDRLDYPRHENVFHFVQQCQYCTWRVPLLLVLCASPAVSSFPVKQCPDVPLRNCYLMLFSF